MSTDEKTSKTKSKNPQTKTSMKKKVVKKVPAKTKDKKTSKSVPAAKPVLNGIPDLRRFFYKNETRYIFYQRDKFQSFGC